jgi:tRNA modification GTPase
MINATTVEAKDLSMVSLTGETSKLFRPIKEKLGEILAHVEVNIDYPEYEDIEQTSKEEILGKCSGILGDIETLISDGEKNRMYKEGLKIAIVGKPNVGKSSLLNALIKEDKAIVTSIAGTTRDIVEGDFNLSGVPIHLYDTAGIRDSKDLIEQIGIDKAKKAVENADLVLFVVDETGFDNELYAKIKDQKHIVVTNKADLIKDKNEKYLYISAKNNDIAPLLNKIKQELNIGEVIIKPTFNNTRQLGILKQMNFYLNNAIDDTKNNQPIDLISVSLMAAYNCALDLLGENNKNDLTDEIFSRFCVGK